jgi:hypothetical protein
MNDMITLTDKQIDELIDAEFKQPLTPATRRALRADVRAFGDMVVSEAGTMLISEAGTGFRVEKLPGHTGAEPMHEIPEIRVSPEMVIRARHLGWSGRQMMIECIKHAMPGASDIEFMGAVDRNN